MTGADRHNNRHRAGKRAFQVMLTSFEAAQVEDVKRLLGATSSRELLLQLCREELRRRRGDALNHITTS